MSTFRNHFPVFANNPDLVFLDSASSSQKPEHVIAAISSYLSTSYSNIHRGAYQLSERSEELFEHSKKAIAEMIGAASAYEIIFTAHATSAANLLTGILSASDVLKKGDRVVLSLLEHHANIVPWQILAKNRGVEIVFVGITSDYQIDYADLESKITPNTRVVSITGGSNVTGTLPDWIKIRDIARSKQNPDTPIYLVMDASQLVAHEPLRVQELDVDFAFFTGHKMFADMGIGVLYGKKSHLKSMYPAIGGGGAINFVTESDFEFAGLPFRYEPGTPNVTGAVSMLAATEFMNSIGGYESIQNHERTIIEAMLAGFEERSEKVALFGPKSIEQRTGVFSFAIPEIHSSDVAELFAQSNIAVRAGHHCAEPLHRALSIPHSVRASTSIYTNLEDVEKFFNALDKILAR